MQTAPSSAPTAAPQGTAHDQGTTLGAPPLSPILFAGLCLRPLPLGPLNILLAAAIRRMHKAHKPAFERLGGAGSPNFWIAPSDLPFGFLLKTSEHAPSLKAFRDMPTGAAAATIRGPLAALIALLEGKIDGDALFFSRTLTVSGDTEAVLALRNAVDGSEIDLSDEAKKLAGPLSHVGSFVGRLIQSAWHRSASDLSTIAASLTARQERQLRSHEDAIETLEKQVRQLSKRSNRRAAKTGGA